MFYPLYHKIIFCNIVIYLSKVFFYIVLFFIALRRLMIPFFQKLKFYRVFLLGFSAVFIFHTLLGWDVCFLFGIFAMQFFMYFIDRFAVQGFFYDMSARTEELAVFIFIFIAIIVVIFSVWIIKVIFTIIYVKGTSMVIGVGMLELALVKKVMEVIVNHPETMFFLFGIGNFLFLYGIIHWEEGVKKTKWILIINLLAWSWYIASLTTGWRDEWGIGLLLSVMSMVSGRACYKNIYKYLKKKNPEKLDKIKIVWLKIMLFLHEKPSLVTTMVMAVGRVICQTIVEIRYGIPGGVMFMGGSGIIGEGGKEEDDLPPHDNLIPRADYTHVVKTLQNNTELPTQRYKEPEVVIDLLPKDPAKDPMVFLQDILQNVTSFKVADAKKFRDYMIQYAEHRKTCQEFRGMTEATLFEFVSCTLIKIGLVTNEKGKITKYPFIVHNHPVDIVIDGVGYQIKDQGNFSGGDMRNMNNKYRALTENESIAFKKMVVYGKLENSERVVEEIKINPEVTKNLEAVLRGRFVEPTKEQRMEFLEFLKQNETHEKNKKASEINNNVLESIKKKNTWWGGCPKGFFKITPPEQKLQITNTITPKQAFSKAIVIVRKLPK